MTSPIRLMDKDLFQEWRQSPMTVEFFQFLRDRQSNLMQAWGQGTAGSHLPEVQVQAILLGRLAAMDWDDVVEQYHAGEDDGQQA